MAVNSVSSNIDLTASYGAKSQQEQKETQQTTRDAAPDPDRDDPGGKSPEPTVNTHGQTVGQVVNTKA